MSTGNEEAGKLFYELGCKAWGIEPSWSALNQNERERQRSAAKAFLAAQGAGEPVGFVLFDEDCEANDFEIHPDVRRPEGEYTLYAGRPPAQEGTPFGFVTTLRNGTQHFYKEAPYLDNAVKCETVYSRPPAPEQAEAPKGFALVPLKPNAEMERLFSEGEWDWCDILAAAESINEAQFDAMRAPEQAEAVRKDAERYRWLRHWHEHVYAVDADGDLILKHHGVGIAGESAERFDAAIDAALAAGEQG